MLLVGEGPIELPGGSEVEWEGGPAAGAPCMHSKCCCRYGTPAGVDGLLPDGICGRHGHQRQPARGERRGCDESTDTWYSFKA